MQKKGTKPAVRAPHHTNATENNHDTETNIKEPTADIPTQRSRATETIEQPAEAASSDVARVNKLVITTKTASKATKHLCTQLRRAFDPDCLSKLREFHIRFKDCLAVADAYRISHLIIVSDRTIQIGQLPHGPTYTFKILEYDAINGTAPSELFALPALISLDGRSELKSLFQHFGRTEPIFRRVIHFACEGDVVHLRHYRSNVQTTDENFKMSMQELGPRLSLQLISREDGFYKKLKADLKRKH